MGLDHAAEHDLHAVAALASASMQFLDLDPAFATLARVIAPRGYVACNLWWHHWEETAAMTSMTGWRDVAETVCQEAQLPLHVLASPTPISKTRIDLTNASRRHGFQLLSEHRDEYPTPIGFGVDFQAMDPNWPVKGCAPEVREALLTRMHELAQGQLESLVSTRFLFQRSTGATE
jgi:hypothetical protein